MAVSYKKLFHMLIDRDISNAQLQKMAGYSANITTRLKNNTYVSLESVEKICGCSIARSTILQSSFWMIALQNKKDRFMGQHLL